MAHHDATATDTMGDTPAPPDAIVLTIEDAAKRLGIGRTLMYTLVKTGEIESVTIGRLRRVPAECLNEYVTRLRMTARQSNVAA